MGLVLVVGLLLVSGTLAVSGGGILSGGGRLGVDPAATASPSTDDGTQVAAASPASPVSPGTQVATTIPPRDEMSHSFAFTCGGGAIRDATRTRWNIARFLVGAREEEGYDRITFELTRRGGKPEEGTVASIEWMDPGTARDELGIGRIAGERALVVTFEGPVDVTANQVIDRLFLDREGVEVVRAVNMFESADGMVRAVVGVNGESCAKMSAPRWKAKEKGRRGKVFLDVERL